MTFRYELTGIVVHGQERPGLHDGPGAHGRVAIRMDASERMIYARPCQGTNTSKKRSCSLLLGFVEANTVVDSLEDWLRSKEDSLDNLARAWVEWKKAPCLALQDAALELQRSFWLSLMHAEAEGLARWATPDEWLSRKGRTQITIADEALAMDSIDDLVEAEHAAALSENVWIDEEALASRIRQIVLDERSEIEDDWPEDDPDHLHTRAEMHRRLHRLRILLGETHPQPEALMARLRGEESCEMQQRIASGMRTVHPEDVARARMILRGLDVERPIDTYLLFAALAAAAYDIDIRDGYIAVRQIHVINGQLEETESDV